MPTVSVVLATRNQARWLDQAIAGVRAQTFTDWDLWVVDDGSTDDTPAVVARHADDPRVRSLREPHRERAAARNRGIAASTGALVAFLDGDDWWLPGKLAAQVAALERNRDAGWSYARAEVVDTDGRPLGERKPKRLVRGDVFAALARGNVLILSSVLVRRTCLTEAGGFDTTLPVLGCEDWDLWLRLASRWPVAVLEAPLVCYRRHDENTAREQVLESALAVIDRHWADPETPRRSGCSRARVRALHRWWHAAALAGVSRGEALDHARRALREAPRTLLSRPALHAVAALARPA